jgi:hypothetical protein
MDAEHLEHFKVRQAPSAKFYVTRQGQAFCTRAGQLVYFETERDARKFLAEIGDIVPKVDDVARRSRSRWAGRGATRPRVRARR